MTISTMIRISIFSLIFLTVILSLFADNYAGKCFRIDREMYVQVVKKEKQDYLIKIFKGKDSVQGKMTKEELKDYTPITCPHPN